MNNEEVSFNICKTMKRHCDFQVNAVIDVVDEAIESIGELAYSKVNDWLKSC